MIPNIAVPIRYPVPFASVVVSPSHDMVTASPPVSPSVVARILMIQNTSVTCGTLATSCDRFLSIFILRESSLPPSRERCFHRRLLSRLSDRVVQGLMAQYFSLAPCFKQGGFASLLWQRL